MGKLNYFSIFKQLSLMKKIVFFLVLMFCVITESSAQVGGLASLLGADKLIKDLDNLGTSMGGNVQIQTNNLSAQLHARMEELKEILGENINKPIEQLSLNMQNSVRSLNSMITEVNAIVKIQRNCLFMNADLVISSLANATLAATQSIRFIGKEATPRITKLVFEGHPAFVVPATGGRANLNGLNLWTSSFAPEMAIFNESRTEKIKNIPSEKGASENDISFVLDEAFVKSQAGNNLSIKVTTFKKGCWLSSKPKIAAELYYSLAIPQNITTKVFMTAFISYKHDYTYNQNFGTYHFKFESPSCEKVKAVNEPHLFMDIPSNCKIFSYQATEIENRPGNNIQLSTNSNTIITAAGTLSKAECTNTPFGNVLHKWAMWEYDVTPICKCTKSDDISPNYVSSVATSLTNTTSLFVDIPKEFDSDKSVFGFTLTRVIGNRSEVFYRSENINSSKEGANTPAGNIEGMTITGFYNPTIVAGKVTVSCTITLPSCGF
jgi:hypothetical protein